MKKFNLSKISKPTKAFIAALLCYVIVIVCMQTGVLSKYNQGILTSVCINIILVVSLNLTAGFLGQLTLGHAGFMSVGAYVAAYLTKDLLSGVPIMASFWIALIVAGIVAALFGLLISVPALRLKGDYLAIITLAFGEIIRSILTNLDIIGGAKGYMGISRFVDLYVAMPIMIVSVYLIYLFVNSQHGRMIKAIAQDEIAANACGVHVKYYKVLTFVIAAFFAGLAGALYAHYMGNLAPKVFDYNMSIELLVMCVLGGMGNITGSIIATLILTALPEVLRSFSDYQMLVYSIVLIGMMIGKYSSGVQDFVQTKIQPLFKKKNKEANV